MNIMSTLGYIALTAAVFSTLFVLARVYASYIRKNDECKLDNCPQKLGGIGHCSIPVAQPAPKAKKPKAKPVALQAKKTPVKKKATTKKAPTKKTPRTKQA
jgi:hypothetical protein